jgi:hypothetical protein
MKSTNEKENAKNSVDVNQSRQGRGKKERLKTEMARKSRGGHQMLLCKTSKEFKTKLGAQAIFHYVNSIKLIKKIWK